MDLSEIAALAEPLALKQDDEGPKAQEEGVEEPKEGNGPSPAAAGAKAARSGRASKPRNALTLMCQCHLQTKLTKKSGI